MKRIEISGLGCTKGHPNPHHHPLQASSLALWGGHLLSS